MSSNEELVLRIQRGEDLKNELYQQIYKLVKLICHKYALTIDIKSNTLEDLYNIAWLGAEKAIQSYNLEKGYKFTTYLRYHIRNAIYEAVGLRGGKLKQEPETISLDMSLGQDDDFKLIETIEDSSARSDLENAEKCDYYDVLYAELGKLPPDTQNVLKEHFLNEKSIAEIADTQKMTTKEVSKLKQLGLRQIRGRKIIRECYYEDYAYRHIGVNTFNNTWTSSTEWATLKIMQ